MTLIVCLEMKIDALGSLTDHTLKTPERFHITRSRPSFKSRHCTCVAYKIMVHA